MALKELSSSSFPLKVQFPFCVQSTDGYNFALVSREKVLILKLDNTMFSELSAFDLSLSYVSCSKFVPTMNIPKVISQIYMSSNVEQRAALQLDPSAIPSLVTPGLEFSIISARWSPPGILPNDQSLLATLNNFGAVEVSIADPNSRIWMNFAPISQLWEEHNSALIEKQSCNTYDNLEEMVSKLKFTAIGWIDSEGYGSSLLACCTESGLITIWRVKCICDDDDEDKNAANLIAQFESNLKKVKSLRWSGNYLHSLLIVGATNGQVKLLVIESDASESFVLKSSDYLWDSIDLLAVESIFVDKTASDPKDNFIFIIKRAHVLIFLVNFDGKALAQEVYYVGNIKITDFIKLKDLQYFITTFTGAILHLIISMQHNKIKVYEQKIEHDLPISKYTIRGATCSRNRAFWLFAMYPTIPFDHLELRSPLKVVVSSLAIHNASEKLLTNPRGRMTDVLDWIALLKHEAGKGDATLEKLNLKLDQTTFDNKMLWKLKLKTLYNSIKIATVKRQKQGENYDSYLVDYNRWSQSIISWGLYKSLKALMAKDRTALSDSQQLAVKNQRNFLKMFLKQKAEGDFAIVRNILSKLYCEVIEKTSFAVTFKSEHCLYCDDAIDDDTMQCMLKHEVSRCCLTQSQVPFFLCKICPLCELKALPDDKAIDEIWFSSSRPLTCPVCDVKLIETKL